jgi:hypothetical protein
LFVREHWAKRALECIPVCEKFSEFGCELGMATDQSRTIWRSPTFQRL